MKKYPIVVAAVVAFLWALAPAADEPATKPADADKEKPTTLADNLAIAEAVAPSLVRVEYTLQYDKGEPPGAGGGGIRISRYTGRYGRYGAERVIMEERPLENPGFLLSPTKVVCPDVMVHPRFIKDIAVRFGDQVVKAKPAAFAKGQIALFLDLAELRDLALYMRKFADNIEVQISTNAEAESLRGWAGILSEEGNEDEARLLRDAAAIVEGL